MICLNDKLHVIAGLDSLKPVEHHFGGKFGLHHISQHWEVLGKGRAKKPGLDNKIKDRVMSFNPISQEDGGLLNKSYFCPLTTSWRTKASIDYVMSSEQMLCPV